MKVGVWVSVDRPSCATGIVVLRLQRHSVQTAQRAHSYQTSSASRLCSALCEKIASEVRVEDEDEDEDDEVHVFMII